MLKNLNYPPIFDCLLFVHVAEGVFTELIREIGVKGIQVEELVTLEDEELNQIK